MSNPKGFIVTLIIVALPIIVLIFQLNSINEEYEDTSRIELENKINSVVSNSMVSGETSGESGEQTTSSVYGNPTSKLIEGAKIKSANTNVYSEPDEVNGTIKTSLPKDMEVTVQDYDNGWSWIKFEDSDGWVKTEYITKPDDGTSTSSTSTTAVGKKGTVIVDTLNVRATAVNGTVIDQLSMNDTFNVIGANSDETWLQVQYGTKTGWISGLSSHVKIDK